MHHIVGNLGTVWRDYCKLVLEKGHQMMDEDVRIKEVLDVMLTFEEFDEYDKLIDQYIDRPLVELYKTKMTTTEIVPELNSSYGKRLYDQLGVDQVAWIVDRLKSKPETKAATISLILPNDPGPRIPCLSTIDIKIREEKVNFTGFFRSQNVSRSYANFISIRDLHQEIASELNRGMGPLKFFVSSAHIYEGDEATIKKIVQAIA